MRKFALIALVFFNAACAWCPLWLFTQDSVEENIFFSYERFYPQASVVKDPHRDGIVQTNISDFMQNYSDGIYAISAGETEKAKSNLLKARAIWPEYFGTDFLLARVNEDERHYGLSARFYKSYLNKLRSLSAGEYRVSEKLIETITPYKIENYDEAYIFVEERLMRYGIDLARVRPVYMILPFIKYLIIFFVIGTGCIAVVYKVIPYIKMRQLIKNPPEGFWVCSNCGTENTLLQKKCEKCDNFKQ
ncbi:MAG: Ran-binding zinc finger domain-containing protein [Candidatus Omnitrophota bacterium]